MITTFGAMPQCQADELAGLAPPEVFVFHSCYVLNFCWNFFSFCLQEFDGPPAEILQFFVRRLSVEEC
jgi:hypothetical protein